MLQVSVFRRLLGVSSSRERRGGVQEVMRHERFERAVLRHVERVEVELPSLIVCPESTALSGLASAPRAVTKGSLKV